MKGFSFSNEVILYLLRQSQDSDPQDTIPKLFLARPQLLSLHSKQRLIPSPPSHNHLKRDQAFLYKFSCLINKGTKYFEEGVLYAAEGFGDPPPNYGPNPFRDNGWTLTEEEDPRPSIWDEVFESIPPRAPNPDEYSPVRLTQDAEFANAWRKDNKATEAAYNGFYIPISNTILMTYTYSPRFRLRQSGGIPEPQIEQHIPRLNTVSDIVWQTWMTRAPEPGKLRFYAIDGVVNEVAAPLMDYLFEKDAEMGWEGRLRGGGCVDVDEESGVLGWRDLRVSIFWEEKEGVGEEEDEGDGEGDSEEKGKDEETGNGKEWFKRCMIWEMIPEGAKSTFDEYESKAEPIRR
ncbi:MAG: hypothetical protein Q9192_005696 [Flavoplaca navasiana]